MADRSRTNISPLDAELAGGVLVVGLGRFGSALAHALVDMGYEVLAVDTDLDRVQEHAGSLTQVIQADTTSEAAMAQIGVADIGAAVVCIGNDIESSVLTTALLADLGVPNIWGKAITRSHGKILRRVGAHHVVFPEADMGERVAHLLSGRSLEYVALDDEFVLAETGVPKAARGKTLGSAGLRADFDVTVVCIKQTGGSFTYATADTVLGEGDLIVIAGRRADVDRFIAAV